MDKKGLNFLVGLGALWVLWRLYWTGWLASMGFLMINETLEQNLTYSSDGVYGTPLAALASLLIDCVTIFGSLVIMFISGIWDILMVSGRYFQDLFENLSEYLKEYSKKPEQPKEDVKEIEDVEINVTSEKPVVKEINPLEVILVELKSIKEEQNKIKEELKHKVETTNIVPEENVNE